MGSGYVVDTLRTTVRLLATEATYEGVVKAAVAVGNDTDTTAAVAGGLAGVRDGVSSIPTRWQHALRGRDLVEPLLSELLAHHGRNS
jgi:ADP-ribosylglycohydrolase